MMVCRTFAMGLTLVGLAGSAHAQKTGSTIDATAVAKIEVGNPSVPTASCGKELAVNLVIKNVGAALAAKAIVNGVATAFTLTKGETKTVTAKGGTFDCTKPPVINISIPSPVAGAMTPLFRKELKPTKLSYATVETQVSSNTTFAMKAATATCGSPIAMYAKFSAPTGTSTPLTISVLDQKLTTTIAAGGNQTLTTTKSLDCALAPAVIKYYTTSPNWLDVVLVGVVY